ncbi:MAG: Gfo/Idh/MocA family oxidoreductase [Anaerolineae bacterium]|uniref:Gfo/Idh/MocA family protein n=1 Tax=Candidatus Amarolinea dominans TaxID=3140696 RepID=UPI003136246E|nr:Gfo/Idh/MocA family oxidoreductase [Anaerolineae bacterium]
MRIGIIGAGAMGSTHAAGWAQTPATLCGFLADPPAEARALAARYQAQVFPNLEALLAAVDVVDVCAPTHLHYPLVLQAAAAGKHIICEKPLALSVAHGQAMIAACRQAGVRLFVAHVVRFFPEYASAQAAVAQGEIGQPAVIRLSRASYQPQKPVGNWFLDPDKSGGMMLDLMVHDFDYARWIAGDVARVYARSLQQQQPEAAVDYALAILTHRNGAISHIEGSWAYPPPTFRTRLEIAGSDGLIECHPDHTLALATYLRQAGAGDVPDVGVPGSPMLENPYTTEIKAFYTAITQGLPARVSAADGLAALQIALAARESAQRGVAIDLPRLPELE